MNLMVEHLQKIFMERCRINESYSLRAFAKSLKVPASSLSEVLNNKRPLTKKLRDHIGQALNMSPEQVRAFEAKPHGNSKNQFIEPTDTDYRQLTLDSFYIISDWYHYGILQLLRTKDFKSNPKWIAKRLNIEEVQAAQAIQRLLRVGILEESKEGDLIDVTEGHTTHLKSEFTNEQLKSFQIMALEKAIASLREVPIQLRDNTSMTMAISKKALPFAKKEIAKFRRQLTKKLESFEQPDEVYQLAIALTPLSITENKNLEEK